jgi:hypothetical protein
VFYSGKGLIMLFNQFTFLGIDPTAGRRPFTYAALDEDLRLLALSQGEMEEVLAFVGGQRQAYVAVCAPRRPNQQLMRRPEIRSELNPSPRPGRWLNCRLVEYQLRQRGIRAHLTPANSAACPRWKQTAFKLYERLETMGYRPYPAGEKTPTQYLEVYPHASFATLMKGIPFPKHTLEGRLQRQLILHENGLNIPDPLRFFEEITRHRGNYPPSTAPRHPPAG